jgi:hypothetical protein
MATRSWPHIPTRRWRAKTLNILAKRAFVFTMRAYWAGLFGPSATYVGLSIASALDRTAMRLLRRRSGKDRLVRDMTLDPQSRSVLKRFLVKIAILSIAALAVVEAFGGLRIAVTDLAMFSGLVSCGLAVFRRQRPMAGSLNYWDEAAAFLAIAAAAQWLL